MEKLNQKIIYFTSLFFGDVSTIRAAPDLNTSMINESPQPDSKTNSVHLPTLDLPNFVGKYEDWAKCRDTFQALINSNGNLTEIKKFYLLSSLKNSAWLGIGS